MRSCLLLIIFKVGLFIKTCLFYFAVGCGRIMCGLYSSLLSTKIKKSLYVLMLFIDYIINMKLIDDKEICKGDTVFKSSLHHCSNQMTLVVTPIISE